MKQSVKRGFDVFVAGFGLLALSPVLLATAVLVLARTGRPVLFTQVRPGLHGAPFTLYKFRTMVPVEGDDASRLTPLGRSLRAISLDELPTLWNVLRGDMSLVGPRPLLMEYLDLYSPEQARRHEVRPGISGLAQISGRNALSWDDKLALDVEYVDTGSLWLDLKILAATFVKVLRREGISQPGHATSEPFRGSDA